MYLDKIAYDEQFGQDRLLFQLDPAQFKGGLASAKAELAQQQALLTNADLILKQVRPLAKNRTPLSQQDLDNAIANQLSAKAQMEQKARSSKRN